MSELLWFSVGLWTAIAAYLLGRVCGMHRHKWSTWTDIANVTFVDETDTPTAYGLRQQRRCGTCGQVQLVVAR